MSQIPACELKIYANGQDSTMVVNKFPCRIGRRQECDITVNEASVSSVHGILQINELGQLVFDDQRSTNGTLHNGARISSIVLDRPMTLYLGYVRIEFNPSVENSEKGQAKAASPKAVRDDSKPRLDCLYRRDGKEFGPFSWERLAEMGRKNELRPDDLIWIPGASDWMRAQSIPGLVPIKVAHAAAPVEPQIDSETARQNRRRARAARNRTLGMLHTDDTNIIVCPHCWHHFEVEDFLFIARHQSLVGDPVLGADAQQRFLQSRFTPEGNAIDSAGMSCPDMACPRCHLRIPQPASEMPPLFISIVGATASGKSYFLTSMIWFLRSIMPKEFAVSFTDTDAISNQILNDFEETLFLPSDPDELVALRKTELQGELYNQVLINGMLINLPKPFMFSLNPTEHHPDYERVRMKMSRTLVVYDNAGEHFEPGMDSVDNPTTQHLLQSDTIFFLYDPTKDIRFRSKLTGKDPQIARGARTQRQEVILTEMVNRIKKYSGQRASTKTSKTLMVIISKCDLWKHLLDDLLPENPWEWDSERNASAFDFETIKSVSWAVRSLLQEICPEVVSTAESFAGDVIYMPNSALGNSPEINPETGTSGIRSVDIKPFWESVPMLYFFHKHEFIPTLAKSKRAKAKLAQIQCKAAGDIIFVTHDKIDKPLQVPSFYAGTIIRCPRSGVYFEVPASFRNPAHKADQDEE